MLTNKNQQGAYRGFGAECSNWMLERLVDMAARDLGMDRVEIRRRNLIAADQFPYRTPTGNIYDSGNYQGVLEKILELGDYEHWVAERDKARAEGRHVGIGVVASNERSVFSSTEFWFWFDQPEFTPTSSPESASLQIDPTGQIVVTLHSQCLWGNSPETVVSQVVAEEFDVDPAGRRHLRRLAARASRHRPRRLALHGHGLRGGRRRRRRGEGEDQARSPPTSSR